MAGDSRPVTTNQDGLHPRLDEVVRRHLAATHRAPAPDHALRSFDEIAASVECHRGGLILDSGCGTGDSTRNLAISHSDHLVLGIDKSASRLAREREVQDPENMVLIRGDMMALYPMIAEAGWAFSTHYLLYPNPWPKAAHLQRRWHGSAVFGDLLRIGGRLELRSNWRIYVDEFARALEIACVTSDVAGVDPADPLTPFERKYQASGHALWSLVTKERA